ncbi:unnamed protein product, partial [Diplocarpon coronariae]
GRN